MFSDFCRVILLATAFFVFHGGSEVRAAEKWSGEFWLTNPDQTALFQKQAQGLVFETNKFSGPVIEVDDTHKYQTMDGFGYALTGGSAMLLHQLDSDRRAAILQELFSTSGTNIGVSYLRVSIGASDLDDHVFSYDDLPEGQTDPEMTRFSVDIETNHLIPVLRQILEINPEIKILGSPWSPPVWLKTNGKTKGGSLKPEFYEAYAKYFVKYIQGMKRAGIRIDAITVQNEPLHPGNNPSMLMQAAEQCVFIKTHLGPAFKRAGIDTKIILYDHNADRPDYPISILNDPEAKPFVDGSAFHLYKGKIKALTKVHKAHPDKNLYFTEQWVGAPGNFAGDFGHHMNLLIIGAPRNWCRNVLEWNLAADPYLRPHTEGGCTQCLGALTIGDDIKRNPSYYIIAHAAKFVRPGSVRVASNTLKQLSNVAYQTPDGRTVLIVFNNSQTDQNFAIRFHGRNARMVLRSGAAGTFVWE